MPIIRQASKERTRIYTVSALNKSARLLLEQEFQTIQIEGELSNLVQAASGHYYFKLKDEKSHIQCAFFKSRAMRLPFKPENGQQVLAFAKVSLYEARGDYQLIIESLSLAGKGQLQVKFEALKNKLKEEGLFDEDRKKALPFLPKQIGIITSPTGAAIHDILTTLKRRFKSIPVVLYPVEVQGARSKEQIVNAILTANHRKECDLIILSRGGGSIEDLWSFNEECVARAIAQSVLPIISGIGHEIDYTIADFCADHRAPTPTAAAESATPESHTLLETLHYHRDYLQKLMQNCMSSLSEKRLHYAHRLRAPSHLIYTHYQSVDKHQREMQLLIAHLNHKLQAKLHELETRLAKQNSHVKLIKQKENLGYLRQRAINQMIKTLQQKQLTLQKLSATLNATSPLATLGRGYSITLTEKNEVVFDAHQLSIGDTFWVKLKTGQLQGELKDIKK
jgi:exodeoxyribonuclease VII large subunit